MCWQHEQVWLSIRLQPIDPDKLMSVTFQQTPKQIRAFRDSTHASCLSVMCLSISDMMSQPSDENKGFA